MDTASEAQSENGNKVVSKGKKSTNRDPKEAPLVINALYT